MYFLHASSTSLQSTFSFTDLRPSFCDSFTISYASLACEEIFPNANGHYEVEWNGLEYFQGIVQYAKSWNRPTPKIVND